MAAKLSNLNPSNTGLLQVVRDQRKKEKTEKTGGKGFTQMLQRQEATAPQQAELLQDYLEKIEEVGARLQKAPTRNALREYRRLIQGFLEQSLKNLYGIDEALGRLNLSTGQRKKYSLIKVIDQKLEELVQVVLSEQDANLSILQRIEEIKGLLVNLLS